MHTSGLLCHAKQVVRRRNVMLADLLSPCDVRWLAILTHAYLHGTDEAREIQSFSDLGVFSEGSENKFHQIRGSGELIEGNKFLTDELSAVLLQNSGKSVWVRNGEMPMPIKPSQLAATMRDVDPDFDFEASASSGEWYLRFKDDDALIFIAATEGVAEELMKAGLDHVLSVSSSFAYAA